MKIAILGFLTTLILHAEHPLATADAEQGRQAIQTWIAKGSDALPELRTLAKSDDPRLATRSKTVIGGITGHWGSQVDLIWHRSLAQATGKNKPIILLQLFGNLDEEFC